MLEDRMSQTKEKDVKASSLCILEAALSLAMGKCLAASRFVMYLVHIYCD